MNLVSNYLNFQLFNLLCDINPEKNCKDLKTKDYMKKFQTLQKITPIPFSTIPCQLYFSNKNLMTKDFISLLKIHMC